MISLAPNPALFFRQRPKPHHSQSFRCPLSHLRSCNKNTLKVEVNYLLTGFFRKDGIVFDKGLFHQQFQGRLFGLHDFQGKVGDLFSLETSLVIQVVFSTNDPRSLEVTFSTFPWKGHVSFHHPKKVTFAELPGSWFSFRFFFLLG